MNPYSVQKIIHHPKPLQMLRERKHQNPTQIHFMPMLACNQHCSFCLVEGTLIGTSRGPVPIEQVRVGDYVVVGTESFRVREQGSRWANNLQRLRVDGYEDLLVTGEHPVFTPRGFVGVDETRAGDRVAADLRLRMRRTNDSLQAGTKVALERLRSESSVSREESFPSRKETVFVTDARGSEPDEASRGPGSGLANLETSDYSDQSVRGRESTDCRGGTETHAGSGQSDEGPSSRQSSSPDGLFEIREDQDGAMVPPSLSRSGIYGSRDDVDSSTESGLSGGSEVMRRGDSTLGLQFVASRLQVRQGLRSADDQALRGSRVEMPRDLPTTQAATMDGAWDSRGGEVFYQGRKISHLRFGKVLVREPVPGTFQVFNLSVEGAEAYVANGVLTHNCSYGHRIPEDGPEQLGWKNMALMSDEFMPRPKMLECIQDWVDMGVKAIELTGGGEPLIYPHVDEFFKLMSSTVWVKETPPELGLVTNGTAFTPERAKLFSYTNWKWARVSIDAGSPERYAEVRRVPASHWRLAWDAVERLAVIKREPDQRVGVGYVVDKGNYDGVYEACRLADNRGADNVRVSLAFTPFLLERFERDSIEDVVSQIQDAKKDFPRLQVVDLVSERAWNMVSPTQDYSFCAVKEVLCVVGGDQKVYTCCSLAFNPKGLIGSIKDQSFRALWEQSEEFFSTHDASKICTVPCLYEKRNKRALELMNMPPEDVAEMAKGDEGLHKNFI